MVTNERLRIRQIYSLLLKFLTGDDLDQFLQGANQGARQRSQVFYMDQTTSLQLIKWCIGDWVGGFLDQMGTGYRGPKAVPEVLDVPGSPYISVKTSAREVIAIVRCIVKDAGWMMLDEVGCDVLTPNLHLEHSCCSLAAVIVEIIPLPH